MKEWRIFLLLLMLISIVGLWGCESLQMEPTSEIKKLSEIKISVNGLNVSQTYQVVQKDNTIYVPGSFLEELGAVADARQGASYTLIFVTENHRIYHVAGTDEAHVDGQNMTLGHPSFMEKDNIYVPISFFEKFLANEVSINVAENIHEIHIELTASDESKRLQGLNGLRQTDYFRPVNLFRYAEYLKKHIELNAQETVIFVNANLDKAFYTDVVVVSQPEDILVLCNKYNQLPKDYEPGDLVHVSGGYYLRAEAATAYQEMIQGAARQNLPIQLRSAYRSYDTQRSLYNGRVAEIGRSQADIYIARPGYSEHQSGLAIDITQPSDRGSMGSANFETTPQFVWLSQHAHEYGFIQRYPKDKTTITGYAFEPWHYRYVGREIAKQIYEQELTFEEYMAMLKR